MKGDLVKKILPLLDDLERRAKNVRGQLWGDGSS